LSETRVLHTYSKAALQWVPGFERLGNMKLAIGLLTCCTLAAGCDASRISKLEKENADLKAKVEKQGVVVDYDLQTKCAQDARTWFKENWSADKDTILLNYTNHYNAKLNKCFVLVEDHYNSHFAGPGDDSWTNDIDLTDVYERSTYAHFAKKHYTHRKPDLNTQEEVITCDVLGKKCETAVEFNNLISQYMND
jgi:hypothetical protein